MKKVTTSEKTVYSNNLCIMKIFQTIQRCFKAFDIKALHSHHGDSSSEKLHRFTVKNSFFCVLAVLNMLSSIASFMFEAKTIFEYYESIHGFLGITICFSFYLMFLWKMDNVFRLIENFENQIKRRKFISIQFCFVFFVMLKTKIHYQAWIIQHAK